MHIIILKVKHSMFNKTFYYFVQVPPAELEALLVSHQSIADAAVVP